MGEFIRNVQDGQVPGPLQRKFSAGRWKKALDSVADPDDSDKNLYSAGLAIHQKLASIRARQKLSSSEKLSATTKLRAFVAAANQNYLVTKKKAQAAVAEAGERRAQTEVEGFRFEELLNVRLELLSGFEASPDEIVENLVDGVETPIKVALQPPLDLSGNPQLRDVEWDDIALELNLGIFYRFAEDVWDDCLWNGYKLVERGDLKLFTPTEIDPKRGHVTGIIRRQALGMQMGVTIKKLHREMLLRGDVPQSREVRAITRDGKRQVIQLANSDGGSETQEDFLVMKAFANEPYYFELLGEPLPSLDGLTLHDVMNGWTIVSQASRVLAQSVAARHSARPPAEQAPAHTWLPEYAPVLQVDALVRALVAAAGFSQAAAKNLVEFLTFRGEPRTELWAKPLVPVGPSTVAPVFAAVSRPNLRRLVDIWMRYAGIDLAKRGPAFEAHVRTTVVEGIQESKVLSGGAFAIPVDYTFTPPGQQGVQFDLVFFIGQTVFIAETKCILEPTESKGVAMHRKTVEEAADQALVRAKVLEEHRERFVADVKQRFNHDVLVGFKVVPFIVLSTTTHVGVPVKGVPVVDEYILGRYLDGELDDVAVQGKDFEVVKTIKNVFFATIEEAEVRAAQYLASPPQMQRLLKGLKGRALPLPPMFDGDWQGMVAVIECVPTEVLTPKLGTT
jgi:hypothetical protein